MEKKLTGTYDNIETLIGKLRYNFSHQKYKSQVSTNEIQELKLIDESKRMQLNKISEEPEMKQLQKESNAKGSNMIPPQYTLHPQILSRKITISMSEKFFDKWVEKTFDELFSERPLHRESLNELNEFHKDIFGSDNITYLKNCN